MRERNAVRLSLLGVSSSTVGAFSHERRVNVGHRGAEHVWGPLQALMAGTCSAEPVPLADATAAGGLSSPTSA